MMSVVRQGGGFSTLCLLVGCLTSEPERPVVDAYSSPSAIATAGGARIALQKHEGSDSGPVVITRLDVATGSIDALTTLVGPHGAPQLAGDDSRAYLTWSDRQRSFGALLAADQTLGTTFELCTGCTVRPYAVGERFLVVESHIYEQHARWIEADGSVGASFPFPGVIERVGNTSVGADLGATLVRRMDRSLAVVRTDGLVIEIDDAKWIGPIYGSVAVLPDGALLASYAMAEDGWVVRVERDGTITSRVNKALCHGAIVVVAERIFGLCDRFRPSWDYIDVFAYELDENGVAIDSGTVIVESASPGTRLAKLPIFSIGSGLLVFDRSSWPTATYFDGTVHPPVLVAGGHVR